MSTLQKIGFTALGSFLIFQNTVFAGIDFGRDKAKDLSGGNVTDAETSIKNLILLFLSFVTLVAVIYVIIAGFQVLIGGSDEKALDKAKKTIINVVVGIIIMWIAYALVAWIIDALRGVK